MFLSYFGEFKAMREVNFGYKSEVENLVSLYLSTQLKRIGTDRIPLVHLYL